MADVLNLAGGMQPTNRIASDTYNPSVGGTDDHPVDFPIGTPVAQSSDGAARVIPGRADDALTASAVGLTAGRAVVGSSVIVQMNGPIHLTAAQWDEITGDTGGLSFGAVYFLDALVEGRMTTTPPHSSGEFVTQLGIALSSTDFLIQIGPATAAGTSAPSAAAMFFGTTTGTGSFGNDYAATVAVGASVPFPRDGSFVGATVVRASDTHFTVVVTGLYEVSWTVGFSEASQLQLAVSGLGVANTCATSGAGTQINSNTVLVPLISGFAVSLINPTGNATALTVQPADGSLTHAQAPNLTFVRLS